MTMTMTPPSSPTPTTNVRPLTLTALALTAAATAASCGGPGTSIPHETGSTSAASVLHTFTSGQAGFDTHSYWLDTGRAVVVFDAQFTEDLARALLADIDAHTKSPITHVIITHPNPDKFNGVGPLRARGAKVVASAATAAAIPGVHAYKKYFFVTMAKMFTDASYPPEATVDITFTGDYQLPASVGADIRLHELTHPGVSSTQTVAWLPAQRALIVGDLVHHQAHAWLEGGIVDGKPRPDLAAWKRALAELGAFEGATVYGGRGVPAPVATAVADQTAYLTRAEAIVTEYLASLADPHAATDPASPTAGAHHAALQARFAAAFPDYQLPYMIGYGIYGLLAR